MGRRKVTSQGFRLSVSELDDFYSDCKSIRPESPISKKQFAKRVEQSYNYFSRLYEQEKSKGRALYVKDSPASYTNQYLNYISVGQSKDIAKQRIRAHIQTTYSEARELVKKGKSLLKKIKKEYKESGGDTGSEYRDVIQEFEESLNVKKIVKMDRKQRWDYIIETLEFLGYDGGDMYKRARGIYGGK